MQLHLLFSIEFLHAYALIMATLMGLGLIWADGREGA